MVIIVPGDHSYYSTTYLIACSRIPRQPAVPYFLPFQRSACTGQALTKNHKQRDLFAIVDTRYQATFQHRPRISMTAIFHIMQCKSRLGRTSPGMNHQQNYQGSPIGRPPSIPPLTGPPCPALSSFLAPAR